MTAQIRDRTLVAGPFTIDFDELLAQLQQMPPDRVLAVAAMLDVVSGLAVRKGQDYGTDGDTFWNYTAQARSEGSPPWHAPARRLGEKAIRLLNLIGQDTRSRILGKGEVSPANEDWVESLQDILWLAAIVVAMRLRESQTTVAEAVRQKVGKAYGTDEVVI